MPHRTTEQSNERSRNVDEFSALEIVHLMNQEDAIVIEAIEKEKIPIASSIEAIAARFRIGGRLFYVGAGTSGRLGVLDASECPPTFNTHPNQVIGVIAGGHDALTQAIEGAEDDPHQASVDLTPYAITKNDTVVGIATSGRTPYVIGALDYARKCGALTIGFSCNPNTEVHGKADIAISPIVGPEVISGSTRLKAGTATKMVLNMLTTGAMILIGKTYGNLMVDLRASNEKLAERSIRIIQEITGLDNSESIRRLAECDGELKTAIVSQLCNIDVASARERLQSADGKLRVALDSSFGGSRA